MLNSYSPPEITHISGLYIYVHGEITPSNLAIILPQQIEITTTTIKHEYFNKMDI